MYQAHTRVSPIKKYAVNRLLHQRTSGTNPNRCAWPSTSATGHLSGRILACQRTRWQTFWHARGANSNALKKLILLNYSTSKLLLTLPARHCLSPAVPTRASDNSTREWVNFQRQNLGGQDSHSVSPLPPPLDSSPPSNSPPKRWFPSLLFGVLLAGMIAYAQHHIYKKPFQEDPIYDAYIQILRWKNELSRYVADKWRRSQQIQVEPKLSRVEGSRRFESQSTAENLDRIEANSESSSPHQQRSTQENRADVQPTADEPSPTEHDDNDQLSREEKEKDHFQQTNAASDKSLLFAHLKSAKTRIAKLEKHLRRIKALYRLELQSRTNQIVALSVRYQADMAHIEHSIHTRYASHVNTALVDLETRYQAQLAAFIEHEHKFSVDRLNSLEKQLKRVSAHRAQQLHALVRTTDVLLSSVQRYEQLIDDYQALCNLYRSFTTLQKHYRDHPTLPFDHHWGRVKASGQAVPYIKDVIHDIAGGMDSISRVGIESSESLLKELEFISRQAMYVFWTKTALDTLTQLVIGMVNRAKAAIWHQDFEMPEAVGRNLNPDPMEESAQFRMGRILMNEKCLSDDKKLETSIKLVRQLKNGNIYKNWLEKAEERVKIECVFQLLLDELRNYTDAVESEIQRQKEAMRRLKETRVGTS